METIFPVLPTPFAAIHESHYHSYNNDKIIFIISVSVQKKNLYMVPSDVNKMEIITLS